MPETNAEPVSNVEIPEPTTTATNANPDRLDSIIRMVQVVSIVIGVIVTVLSFNDTHQKEAVARKVEAEQRNFELQKYMAERQDVNERQRAEAARPFLELRQKAYLEAVQNAAILATAADHTPQEVAKAKRRFKELYIAELSIVESEQVEGSMVDLAGAVDPSLRSLTSSQAAALHLSHALRDSLVRSWHVDPQIVDVNNSSNNPTQP